MNTTELNQAGGFYFDTYNTIMADCGDAALRGAMALCERYERLLSKTVEGSDVWRINHAGGAPTEVDEETARILRLALEMRERSRGAFNIAVGELVGLWRVTAPDARVPPAEDLRAGAERIGRGSMALEGRTFCLSEGLSIDLGGIAKGYITDRVADHLRAGGVCSALLNFGGNVVTVGRRPDGAPWRLGLQTPGGRWGQDYWAVLECCDRSLVTSGIYERGFEERGVRYHHILDPRSGWPVRNGLVSVSVLCADSMLADALSTAMFVLGPAEGASLAARCGAEYVFLTDQKQAICSPGLPITVPRE